MSRNGRRGRRGGADGPVAALPRTTPAGPGPDQPDVPTQRGAPVSREEVERLRGLRALFDPASSLKVVDDFAKYLFTSAAIVGTIAGGLKVTDLTDLHGVGADLFSFAIVALAASLACAILALLPLGMRANPNKTESLQGALGRLLRFRLGWITAAGLLFALAIGLAGAAPFVSQQTIDRPDDTGVGYTVGEDGRVVVTGTVAHAKPFSYATLALTPSPAAPTAAAVSQRVAVNADGRATITATVTRTDGVKSFTAKLRWRDEEGALRTSPQQRVPVRSTVAPARPARPARPASRPAGGNGGASSAAAAGGAGAQ